MRCETVFFFLFFFSQIIIENKHLFLLPHHCQHQERIKENEKKKENNKKIKFKKTLKNLLHLSVKIEIADC